MINSCTCEVSQEFTLKITDAPKIILLPMESYRGDLKITDSEDKEMILLSDQEFLQTQGIPISKINEEYLREIHVGLPMQPVEDRNTHTTHPSKYLELTKNHRLIAVILRRTESEYYEKIKLSWVQRVENRKRDKISQHVEIPIYIQRYGLQSQKTSSVYLSIKIAEKYEILGKPTFVDYLTKKHVEHLEIMNDSIHQIYRFDDTEEPQLIQSKIKISVPIRMVRWMQTGIIAAIAISSIIISMIIFTDKLPPFAFEALGGTIGFLIGERIILLQDLSLMKWWNSIHILAAGGCVILIIGLMISVGMGWLLDPQHIIPIVSKK